MSTVQRLTGRRPAASPTDHRPAGHVVVIGGGISGLAAAHRLLEGGARVTVLEASPRLGGKLLAGRIAGAAVDLGAESMLARRPEAIDLARAVGLGDALQPPTTGVAAIWTRGALRPMPLSHVMGVPGDPFALDGVVSEAGVARIAQDAGLPRTHIGEDTAIGTYVAARLGNEVVDRLVEPLLGGVYAGDAYRISMRAAVPRLFEAAKAERSLLAAVRSLLEQAERASAKRKGSTGSAPSAGSAAANGSTTSTVSGNPVFMGIVGGVGRLPLAVADACRAAGAEIETDAEVRELSRTARGWTVVTDDGTEQGRALEADAVVVAVPAAEAARLLAAQAPVAAQELRTVEYASMALVTMAFRRADLDRPPVGRGFLVPSVDGRDIKAATFCTSKWDWVREQDPELFVLRTSIGRFEEEELLRRTDDELVELSLRELAEAIGLSARPIAQVVTRWDRGLPQYPVGHLDRTARIRVQAAKLPGLSLCGAAYDGVGIPACIAGGRQAADTVLATLPVAGAPGE